MHHHDHDVLVEMQTLGRMGRRSLRSKWIAMWRACLIAVLMMLAGTSVQAASQCGKQGVWVQVLGSGGPEINDGRASSAYLIWENSRARILVDMGGGSMLRFEQSGARLEDLDIILLSHLHVDHSADLPYLVKASFFTERDRDLPLYGPSGNQLMPGMTEFVHDLFGSRGAFRYLSDYLDGREAYRLIAHDINVKDKHVYTVMAKSDYQVSAVSVHHGPIPAVAYRIDIAGHRVVFSGDMNNDYHTLAGLAAGADLLVAHHAIPEHTNTIARNLHMPPSVIGEIAAKAAVKQLVLSHRMRRTLGHEQESLRMIRQHYRGPVHFAEDLQCFDVQPGGRQISYIRCIH